MDVIQSMIFYAKKIKSFLIFFYAFALISCNNTNNDAFSIAYENGVAKSIVFSAQGSFSDYKVSLRGKEQHILGNYKKEGSQIRFTPVIPFSAGEEYQIFKKGGVILEFQIQHNTTKTQPRVVGIYPAIDTVPENLLKMYFVFSEPMQQSTKTLDFIKVFDNETKEEKSIFLSLENELWNLDRTELTLWLDPGRIKKDLIPNQKFGTPLVEGKSYTIKIQKGLENAKGIPLGKSTEKRIVVTKKDNVKPTIDSWQLTIPNLLTKEALGISLNESLDKFLLEETIQLYSGDTLIEGAVMVSKKATSLLFIPKKAWEKGRYRIVIESRLEDLAGNNLNRLFDRDLQNGGEVADLDFYSLSFTIQ